LAARIGGGFGSRSSLENLIRHATRFRPGTLERDGEPAAEETNEADSRHEGDRLSRRLPPRHGSKPLY
jgi:hypothetical protein